MKQINFHEDLAKDLRVKGSSDRNFGLIVGAFLTVISLLPLRTGGHIRTRGLALAVILILVALLKPSLLKPLNRWWMRLGLLLGKVMNPVASAILFFVVFTPAGIVIRMFGGDLLHLKYSSSAASYWILRDPPGPSAESMPKQF
jgi:hypothetical protein